MGKTCIVEWCKSSQKLTPEKSFFGFPKKLKKPEEHQKWMNLLGIRSPVPINAFVCSDHFQASDIEYMTRNRLRTGALPQELGNQVTHSVSIQLQSGEGCRTYVQINESICLEIVISNATENDDRSKSVHKAVEVKSSSGANLETTCLERLSKLRRQLLDLQSKLTSARKYRFKSMGARDIWRKSYQSLLAKHHKNLKDMAALKSNLKSEATKVHTFYQEKFGSFLTQNQIRKVLAGPKVRWIWFDDDVAQSITLMYASNSYNELRKRNFPLPAPTTLRKQAAKIQCRPGIQHSALNLIKYKFRGSNQLVRECVILFDEVGINPSCEYDPETDRVYGNCNNLQVVMIRGLYHNWQQMVSFDFNQKFTPESFQELIREIEGSGLTVRGVVSDMGTKNVGLYKSLGVSVKLRGQDVEVSNTLKSMSTTNHNIYFFADAPHLVKALRNNLVNHGLLLASGHKIMKSDFVKLIQEEEKQEIRACWKLTRAHLNLNTKEKMRVYLAVQLFSRSVAAMWRKVFPQRPAEASFIELVNDWFDVMNSRHLNEPERRKKPYGFFLLEQQEVIAKMETAVKGLKVLKDTEKGYNNYMFPFQKGIMLTSKSIRDLYQDVSQGSLRTNYILTAHVNQDILESFFARLRSLRGFNNNPTAVDAMRRLKLLMFAKCKSVSKAANVSVHDRCDEEPIASITAEMLHELKQTCKENHITDVSDQLGTEDIDIEELENLTQQHQHWSFQEKCHEYGLEYISGFFASKLGSKFPYLLATDDEKLEWHDESWVLALQKEHLKVPSITCRNNVKRLDAEFVKYHENGTNIFMSGVSKGFSNALEMKYSNIPKQLITAFVKTRLRIHVKYLNHKIKEKTMEKADIIQKRTEAMRLVLRNDDDQDENLEITEFGDNLRSSVESSDNPDFLPIHNSDEFSWSPEVKSVLHKFIGDHQLKPLQKASVNACLTGVDVFLISGTGSGKSLVYQLTSMLSSGVSIVVSPLISLIQNQVSNNTKYGLKSVALSGDDGHDKEQAIYKSTTDPGTETKVVFVTPEKMTQSSEFLCFLRTLHSLNRLDRVVVDEIHCILDWGQRFRPSYVGLGKVRKEFHDVPFLGLTATATHTDIDQLKSLLDLKNLIVFREPCFRPNLSYNVIFTEEANKENLLVSNVLNYKDQCGIIYCLTRRDCDKLTKVLKSQGLEAAAYHSEIGMSERELILRNWMSGSIKIVVATVAFGMGIDKSDCRFVFHKTIPKTMTNLVQECGRAGRDGLPGACTMFVSLDDVTKMLSSKALDPKCKDVRPVIEFVLEHHVCRSKLIAQHFGDEIVGSSCECTICKSQDDPMLTNVTPIFRDILKVLDLARENKMNMTAKMITNVLKGRNRNKIFQSIIQEIVYDDLTLQQIILKAYLSNVVDVFNDPLPFRTICYFRRGLKSKEVVNNDVLMYL